MYFENFIYSFFFLGFFLLSFNSKFEKTGFFMKSRLDMVNHDHDLNVAETIFLDFKRFTFSVLSTEYANRFQWLHLIFFEFDLAIMKCVKVKQVCRYFLIKFSFRGGVDKLLLGRSLGWVFNKCWFLGKPYDSVLLILNKF